MSVSISELWVVISVAGVLCWVASALIHMLFKYHNADYKPLSNEGEVANALRASNAVPALYTMPYCKDMKEMGSNEMQQKFATGPVAMISVLPDGMPNMGKALGLQVLFFVVGSVFIAYLASLTLNVGADYMTVFQFVFVASFVTYGWGQVPYSIWMGQPWSNCARYLLDALIYGGVTAGTFAWLWPSISVAS